MLVIPGYESAEVYKANAICREADERASFKRNPDTGQFCVYMKLPRGTDPEITEIPVVGFNYVPGPDELKRWLYEHDGERHGHKIRTDMNARNAKRKADADRPLDDLAGDTAERMAATLNRTGEHPWHTSYRKVKKRG